MQKPQAEVELVITKSQKHYQKKKVLEEVSLKNRNTFRQYLEKSSIKRG